ncbi:hypothetical protein PR202_ga11628 [Eleusine coracana subsp. coracana]|uniref:Agenet domain-containing protein n=1 Tax=Eleusine coracana subsp. coracana TaxID=191504 RepID=A0AAV5CA21_ELECO|nr:hypothetical protein PR202_ga11628 [Eleusine coracana subsp. coracana]
MKLPPRPPPPSTPSPPAPTPLPPGAEVEVRVDGDFFHGSWFEGTIVDFFPGRGSRSPGRYTVSYSHVEANDGGALVELFAPSRIRPRPPLPSSPPRFLPHDIVEAFLRGGWWSGVVVAAADPSPAAAPVVTVAFPITREVVAFAPRLVRPRRDYVDGEWVPSRTAIAVQPKCAVKAYEVGEMVEVLREREVGGDHSWLPATVLKVVDPQSYIVEYLDQAEGGVGEKAMEYLHCRFIRPAVEHWGNELQLEPGAKVDAYCNGAWWPGVVCRVVGEGEYEVRLNGKGAKQLVTMVMELLRPQYNWDGKQWRIVSAKRQAYLKRKSASGKSPISYVEEAFGDGEYKSCDPESSATKKSRKELEQPDVILSECSEHASVIEADTNLSASHKSQEGDNSLNYCSKLPRSNSLQVLSHRIVSGCSVVVKSRPCASTVHSTPPCKSIPNVGEAPIYHDTLSNLVLPENKEHHVPTLHEKSDASDNVRTQLKGNNDFTSKEINCAMNASTKCLKTAAFTRQVSTGTNSCSNMKVYKCKKLAKRKALKVPQSPQRSMDATSIVQQRGANKVAGQRELSSFVLEGTKSQTQQQHESSLENTLNIHEVSCQELLPLEIEPKGIDIHGSVLEEEPDAMINSRISQANRNANVLADNAATQVAKSNHLMESPTLSLDNLNQLDGGVVDQRSILLQNVQSSQCTTGIIRDCSVARCSTAVHLATSQNTDHEVPFIKSSPMWAVIEAFDVFKDAPQRPHFLPLQQFSPSLREGMALGLMVTFDNMVEGVRKSSIDDSVAAFKGKIKVLGLLKENGFDVQSLLCYLTKLFQIKSDHTKHLEEKNKLKVKILEKTTTTSRVDSMLDKSDRAIAEHEKTLEKLRCERQKIAKKKEHEDAELSRVEAAHRSIEHACSDAEQEFHNILAELQRKL